LNILLQKRLIIPTKEVFYEQYRTLQEYGFDLKELATIGIQAINRFNQYQLLYLKGYCITNPSFSSSLYEELYTALDVTALECIDRNPNSHLVHTILGFIYELQGLIEEVLYRSHIDIIYSDLVIYITEWLGEDIVILFKPR